MTHSEITIAIKDRHSIQILTWPTSEKNEKGETLWMMSWPESARNPVAVGGYVYTKANVDEPELVGLALKKYSDWLLKKGNYNNEETKNQKKQCSNPS